MAAAGIISGIIGAASGIANIFGSAKRKNEALNRASQENDKQRYWQQKMYERQVADNRQNAREQREWESPENQMALLKQAGLNPDLMYGGLNSGSGIMPQSGSVGSVGYDTGVSAITSSPTAAQSMLAGIDAMKGLAETENIKADTAKKSGELDALNLDNFRKAATQGSQIELDNFQITLAKKAANLTDSQISKLTQEINNLQTQNELCNQQITESIAKVRNMDSVTLNNRISAFLSGSRFDMEVKRFQQDLKESDSRINLNNQQAKEILTLMVAKKLNLDADTLLKKVGSRLSEAKIQSEVWHQSVMQIEGRQMQFNYEQTLNYDDAERLSKIAGHGLSAVGEIIRAFASGMGLGTIARKATDK